MQKDLALIILPPAIWPVLDYALEIGLCFCEKNPSSVLYLISVDRTLRFNPSKSKYDLASLLESEFKIAKINRFF